MKNIVKAQIFQYGRQSIIIKIFIIILLFSFAELAIFALIICPGDEITPTAGRFVIEFIHPSSMITLIFLVFNTAYICCADFSDKTANYEIMTGHTRLEVFLGRLIWTVSSDIVGLYILLLLPVAAAGIMFGWGNDIPIGQMALRWLLMLFPTARLAVEIAAAGFIIRKLPAVLICSYIIYMGSTTLTSFCPESSFVLAAGTLNCLMTIDRWETYGLGVNEIYFTHNASLSAETALMAILSSLAAILVFGFAGYSFFRTDDIE